jgi:hypothetical protein
VNLSETALILAQMQAYDQRTVGESDVIAWQALLADASFQDCQEAVRQHYAEETDRIMPAHVRRLVRDITRARQVSPWAPGQHGVPKDQAMPEVESGPRLALSDLPGAVAGLLARVGVDLPEGSREALKPRTVAWEREHGAFLRTQSGEPNPLYKPQAAPGCLPDQDGRCLVEGHTHYLTEEQRLAALVPELVQCRYCPRRVDDPEAHEAREHPEA